MFQTKVVGRIKTYILWCNKSFSKFVPFYEIMWKNMVGWVRPQMAKWRMRLACWTTKATNTHSEYVILFAFTRQQWLTLTRLSVTLYVRCLSCLTGTLFQPLSLTACHTAELIGTNTPECWWQCYVTQLNSVLVLLYLDAFGNILISLGHNGFNPEDDI
jgi:hypothetical protein